MPVPYLQSKNELAQYLSQCEALVLYFTATWCGPCRAIAPVMEQLYTSYPNVEIVKIDLDTQRQVVSKYDIRAVPTFVFLHKGSEIDRVRGAGVKEVFEKVQELSKAAPQGKRLVAADGSSTGGSSGSSDGVESVENSEVSKYIKGYKVLNKAVFFGEFESLNALPLNGNKEVQNVVRAKPEGDVSGAMSDADSQLLLHIPMTNVCKVASILIKVKDHENTQKPEKVKVWCNRASIISFEDATSTSALHEAELSDWDENGWCEIKLKYVRFQKVTSLDLFLDGDDEDENTVIDRVLIVGVDGEPKNQGKIEQVGHE